MVMPFLGLTLYNSLRKEDSPEKNQYHNVQRRRTETLLRHDERKPTMHTDLITDGDGQRTQVGPDPLDYVLRYTACDYDCYHQGRYIGSRATLPKAIEAVAYEQAKAARHPQLSPSDDIPIATYHDE